VYEKFITKFIQDNKFKLVANDIDIIPFHNYREYEPYFVEVINSKDFVSMNDGNMDFMGDRDGNIPHDTREYNKDEIGQYITRGGTNYDLAILQYKSPYDFRDWPNGKKYLAASQDDEHLSGIP